MSAPRVINPLLYNALRRISNTGDVEVSNRGVGAKQAVTRKLTRRGLRTVTELSKGAEHYRINCPFCGDTGKRLWVNHLYGTPGLADQRGMNWLASCYNEHCLEFPDNARKFEDQILDAMSGRAAVLRPPTVEDGDVLTVTTLPGRCELLSALPSTHPTNVYLRGRQYDVNKLATYYGISAVVEPPPEKRWLLNYVIIPIRMHGDLVGWQGRHPADLNWKQAGISKYYNLPGMPKRLFLYNHDNARRYGSVVVVEGVTSVWKIGGPTVAIFGKSLSQQQRRLLLEWNSVVFMLDNDDVTAQAKMRAMYEDVRRHRPCCMVELPEGTDPANFERGALWDMIRSSAAAADVTLETQVLS